MSDFRDGPLRGAAASIPEVTRDNLLSASADLAVVAQAKSASRNRSFIHHIDVLCAIHEQIAAR